MIALLSRKSTKAERTSGGENDQYSEKLSYLNDYRVFSRYELLVFKILRRNGDKIRSGPGPPTSERLSMTVYLYKEVRLEACPMPPIALSQTDG